MNLTKPPTPGQQLSLRLTQLYCLHHECAIHDYPVAPFMEVLRGEKCVVMVADAPFMVVRYVDKAKTAWLFDAYGT